MTKWVRMRRCSAQNANMDGRNGRIRRHSARESPTHAYTTDSGLTTANLLYRIYGYGAHCPSAYLPTSAFDDTIGCTRKP